MTTVEGVAQPIRLSANLLLEFGAVLQLALWEQDGFTAHLDAGLPSYTDAFAELARKTEQDEWDGETIATNSLSFEVYQTLDGRVLLGRALFAWHRRAAQDE